MSRLLPLHVADTTEGTSPCGFLTRPREAAGRNVSTGGDGAAARRFPYLQQLRVEQQGVRRLRVVVTLLVQVAQFVQVPEAGKHRRVLTMSPDGLRQ